jgi:hypothetical protein
MSSDPAHPLHEVARAATDALPFQWIDSPLSTTERVIREGCAGPFDVTVLTYGDDARVFRATASLRDAVSPSRREEAELLCQLANGFLRTANFCVSPGGGDVVRSSASLVFTRFRGDPDPKLLENLITRAILNAAFIAPIFERFLDGASFGTAMRPAHTVMRELLSNPPAYLPDRDRRPASDADLVNACQGAAHGAGFDTRRHGPDRLEAVLCGSPSCGATTTYVDVLEDCIVTCSYPLSDSQAVPRDRVGAVMKTVTLLLEEEPPYAISVAPELGSIQVRSLLDLAGVAKIPPVDLLVDSMMQSAVGAVLASRPVLQAAHGARTATPPHAPPVDTTPPSTSSSGSLRERLERRRAS